MTPEMNWINIEINHVIPVWMFGVSKHKNLQEGFEWKNTQPLLEQDRQHKGIKFSFLGHQFLKLNEEGLNQDIHWCKI